VKGAEAKAKSKPGSALDRISERIVLALQTLSRPEAIQGLKNKNFSLDFNMIWRMWSQSPLILLPFLLPTRGKPQFQPRECVTAWVEPHPPISLSRATINPKARPMTLKNAMPRNMRCMF
jgi:hypothetical protein